MTTINLAPTTKEALTEKLRHYFQTLGNLNALDVTDDAHTKISEDITSAFIDTLTDPNPVPAQKGEPIGYVVAYVHTLKGLIHSESLNKVYPSFSSAKGAIDNALLPSHNYKILPVYSS
jgi:hypothetical protein